MRITDIILNDAQITNSTDGIVFVADVADGYEYVDAHDDEEYDSNEDFDDFLCEYDEGELTDFKARLVQKKKLAYRIDLLGFADYLFMRQGDIDRNVERQESVKEDLFEAILGAVALDSNWDLVKLERVVDNMLCPDAELDNDDEYENFIGQVQDWCTETAGTLPRRGYFSLPTYKYKENHDEDGNPIWACQCKIKEVDIVTNGRSSSKKDAKKQAAFDMLNHVLGEE